MRVMVLGNAGKSGVREEAERLLPFIAQCAEITCVDLEQKLDLCDVEADVALVLGGDGAILRAARQMGYRQVPVLGVNLGKLGFLADLTPEEAACCLVQLLRREYRVANHLMFECGLEQLRQKRTFLGLNEVAIETG